MGAFGVTEMGLDEGDFMRRSMGIRDEIRVFVRDDERGGDR